MTDWNERHVLGDTPWEKGAPAPPLLSWMARYGPMTGDVLVPGCGLGHDVREIAKASPDARVVGLDLAPEALASSGKKVPVTVALRIRALERQHRLRRNFKHQPKEMNGQFMQRVTKQKGGIERKPL